MESNERPPQFLCRLEAGFWPWILPDFHDQRAKIIKNHKIKNTPSILISFKMIKKIQKNQKSENLVVFEEFGDRWARRLGVNHFLKNSCLRVTDDTKSRKVRDFPWDDHRLLFGRTLKTHFLLFSISKICIAILHWLQCWKTRKNSKIKQIHPNWRQNKLVKCCENRWNSFKMDGCIEFPP